MTDDLSAVLSRVVLESLPGRSGKRGLTSAYGWIWRGWLAVPSGSQLDDLLRVRLFEHASRNGIPVGGRPEGLTLASARQALGAGHPRARRLLEASGLVCGHELPGRPMALDAACVDRLAKRVQRLITSKEAARLLGIGRNQFRALRQQRIIFEEVLARRSDGPGLFDPDELHGLMRRLRGSEFKASEGGDWTSLPIACRNESVPLGRAIEAILKEELPRRSAATESLRLDGVLVSPVCLRKLRPPRVNTIASAAKLLGIHYEAARFLTANGLLGRVPGKIEPVCVERFQAAYMTTSQAGAIIGLNTRGACGWLKQAGLRPAFGPPACRQALWSRSEALHALAAKF